jgi:predicted amidophosphoribosyltransferase
MTAVSDRYPSVALGEGMLRRWDGDDYAVLRYRPKSRTGGTYDAPSQLLIDFKQGLCVAEDFLGAIALTALQGLARDLRDARKCAFIVPLPSHQAGRTAGPCQRLAAKLAMELEWLEYWPALVRHRSVPKSATAAPGERPTREEHKASMKFAGPSLAIPDKSIIMLDDVITAGETSAAGREVLLEATRCRSVVGFFLARTTYA